MNKKIVITVIVLVVLAVLGFYMFGKSTGNVVSGEDVKTFVLTGDHLRFYMNGVENPDLVVKQGDRVRIELTNTEGYHDWVLAEFGAQTEAVRAVNSTSVEFVADKKGTFEYYCSIGKHRANGMKGKFIVE